MGDDKKDQNKATEEGVKISKPKVELKELEVEDADEVKGGMKASRDTLMCGW